jgi:hypothetical protein
MANQAQKVWTPLSPAGRRQYFRMGNVPMIYSPWSELSEHERELVENAYRIVTNQCQVKRCRCGGINQEHSVPQAARKMWN